MPLWGKQKVSQLNSKRLSCFSHHCICRTGRKGMVKRMKISPAEVRPWSFGSSKWIRWLGLGLIEVVSMNLFRICLNSWEPHVPLNFFWSILQKFVPENLKTMEFGWDSGNAPAAVLGQDGSLWAGLGKSKKAGRLAARSASNFWVYSIEDFSRDLQACKELDLRYLHLGEETHQLVRNPR